MKIIAVVVTCNRLALLPRALKSIENQNKKPDFVFVISNSTPKNFEKEEEICDNFGFKLCKNTRTANYAGALNTAVEEIIKCFGIEENIYLASLDDDDEWLPAYLQELENQNTENYDLLVGNLLRKSETENLLLTLPENLLEKDFLIGNPGVCGSNTFIRLSFLLYAGGFDEAMPATIDRDFMVRVFQQKPKHKIINKHLVNQYTDNNRTRVTISGNTKKQSLRAFYYKYHSLMSDGEKESFFDRAEKLFSIPKSTFENNFNSDLPIIKQDIEFQNKGNYQFVIGFIAGNAMLADRMIKQILEREIPTDFILIIENIPQNYTLDKCENLLRQNNLQHKIVKHNEWHENLKNGHYGEFFKSFATINSIPLGRSILQHHLYTETIHFENPVFWILDDDMAFYVSTLQQNKKIDLFEIIHQHYQNSDAIIGGCSNDPPLPNFSCMRSQLLDFLHSFQTNNTLSSDFQNIREKIDYYYDLSDIHSNHLEMPIYHKNANEETLGMIFSGKAISRPALQKELKSEEKTITRRGGNTLIFNREMLRYYPVVNLQVNNCFARRGDLLWVLFHQIVSGKRILEHSFSLAQDRIFEEFNPEKEISKVSYDIIGYAFNRAVIQTINTIKTEINDYRPKNILEKLNNEKYYQQFGKLYHFHLQRRKTKFLMNYYRIIGLTKLLSNNFENAKEFHNKITDKQILDTFTIILKKAESEETLNPFFKDLTLKIWAYNDSFNDMKVIEQKHRENIEQYFDLKTGLQLLGSGAEGVVFTDNQFVYKSFFDIFDNEWNFLKEKSACFGNSNFLAEIECFENKNFRFIRYPYQAFKPLAEVNPKEFIEFLKFCKSNEFVFTNIKPKNFIQTFSGQVKLIDYGKSFEPYTEEKLQNATKRAYLLCKNSTMENKDFQKLTAKINIGELPDEILGWENFWYAVSPRTKEEILDTKIIEAVKEINPKYLLDFGAGKCKTAKAIRNETNTEVFVFDIDTKAIEQGGKDFPKYYPNNSIFDKKFDCVLLNIVLCVVDNQTMNEILSNVSKALKINGKVIVSICNPDFAHICKTEFQNRDFMPRNIGTEAPITKTCIYTGNQKIEYHRPTENYIKTFAKCDFEVKQVTDTKGIDIETLKYASDFKIFILNKIK